MTWRTTIFSRNDTLFPSATPFQYIHVERVKAAAADAVQEVITGAQAKKLVPYEHATPKGYILPNRDCYEFVAGKDEDGDDLHKTYEELDRKSTRLNSSHSFASRMPYSARKPTSLPITKRPIK